MQNIAKPEALSVLCLCVCVQILWADSLEKSLINDDVILNKSQSHNFQKHHRKIQSSLDQGNLVIKTVGEANDLERSITDKTSEDTEFDVHFVWIICLNVSEEVPGESRCLFKNLKGYLIHFHVLSLSH